jgi:hypothetical protein
MLHEQLKRTLGIPKSTDVGARVLLTPRTRSLPEAAYEIVPNIPTWAEPRDRLPPATKVAPSLPRVDRAEAAGVKG